MDKSPQNTMRSSSYALFIELWLYSTIGVLGYEIFHSQIDISILTNFGEEHNTSSTILMLIFIVVLACHVPFCFYPAKETFLVLIDETINRSMSKGLTRRFSQVSED